MTENDSYEDVALILCGFLCENCPTELIDLPDRDYEPNSGWEKEMGELAKSLHWFVKPMAESNDWKILCPVCARETVDEKPETG